MSVTRYINLRIGECGVTITPDMRVIAGSWKIPDDYFLNGLCTRKVPCGVWQVSHPVADCGARQLEKGLCPRLSTRDTGTLRILENTFNYLYYYLFYLNN